MSNIAIITATATAAIEAAKAAALPRAAQAKALPIEGQGVKVKVGEDFQKFFPAIEAFSEGQMERMVAEIIRACGAVEVRRAEDALWHYERDYLRYPTVKRATGNWHDEDTVPAPPERVTDKVARHLPDRLSFVHPQEVEAFWEVSYPALLDDLDGVIEDSPLFVGYEINMGWYVTITPVIVTATVTVAKEGQDGQIRAYDYDLDLAIYPRVDGIEDRIERIASAITEAMERVERYSAVRYMAEVILAEAVDPFGIIEARDVVNTPECLQELQELIDEYIDRENGGDSHNLKEQLLDVLLYLRRELFDPDIDIVGGVRQLRELAEALDSKWEVVVNERADARFEIRVFVNLPQAALVLTAADYHRHGSWLEAARAKMAERMAKIPA